MMLFQPKLGSKPLAMHLRFFFHEMKGVKGARSNQFKFRPRTVLFFFNFCPVIWVYLKIRYTQKNRTEMVALVGNPMEDDFLKAPTLKQRTYCNKKKRAIIIPMCNKLPIIQVAPPFPSYAFKCSDSSSLTDLASTFKKSSH